jgi:hypothetical protein
MTTKVINELVGSFRAPRFMSADICEVAQNFLPMLRPSLRRKNDGQASVRIDIPDIAIWHHRWRPCERASFKVLIGVTADHFAVGRQTLSERVV